MQSFLPHPSENPVSIVQATTFAVHIDQMVADVGILIETSDYHVSMELLPLHQRLVGGTGLKDGYKIVWVGWKAEVAAEDQQSEGVP